MQIKQDLKAAEDNLEKASKNLEKSNENLENLQMQLQSEITLYNEMNIDLAKIETAEASLKQDMKLLNSTLTEDKFEVLKKEDKKLIDKIQDLRTENHQTREKIAQYERQMREANRLISQYNDKIKNMEIAQNTHNISLEGYLERMNEYKILYDTAKEKYHLEVEVEVARLRVKNLKQQIHNIGAVNELAIEDYEKVKERVDYVTEQEEDLIKAKDSLLETISELDEVMLTRFEQTFHKINEEFNHTFRMLCGGGGGDSDGKGDEGC